MNRFAQMFRGTNLLKYYTLVIILMTTYFVGTFGDVNDLGWWLTGFVLTISISVPIWGIVHIEMALSDRYRWPVFLRILVAIAGGMLANLIYFEEVGVVFVASNQAAIVKHPDDRAFDFPTSHIPPQLSSILHRRFFPASAMRPNQIDAGSLRLQSNLSG